MKKPKTWLDKGTEKILKKPEYANKKLNLVQNGLPYKMSEVLLDFALPLTEYIDKSDRRAFRSAIQTAIYIWNYAIIDSGRQWKTIKDSTADGVKSLVNELFNTSAVGIVVMTTLLERKKSLYPDINTMIPDFDLSWDKKGEYMHLTVFSAG